MHIRMNLNIHLDYTHGHDTPIAFRCHETVMTQDQDDESMVIFY